MGREANEESSVSEPVRFALSDPDGTFLTLSTDEARALLADFRDDDGLSPNLQALRVQLEEWLVDA